MDVDRQFPGFVDLTAEVGEVAPCPTTREILAYYSAGKIHSAPSRDAAIEGKAEAQLRRSKGIPEPDTRVTIAMLAEEVRESKRRKLRGSSFNAFEYALDKIVLVELGHLRVVQVGPDRIARLIRDLEARD